MQNAKKRLFGICALNSNKSCQNETVNKSHNHPRYINQFLKIVDLIFRIRYPANSWPKQFRLQKPLNFNGLLWWNVTSKSKIDLLIFVKSTKSSYWQSLRKNKGKSQPFFVTTYLFFRDRSVGFAKMINGLQISFLLRKINISSFPYYL